MDVALQALGVASLLMTVYVFPVLERRRAAGTRAKVEAALAVGAEVGPLRLVVAVAVREGASWRTGTLRYAERRMTWRRRHEELDLTDASVRSWRELEKPERKKVRPYPMRVALLCSHPELGDFELTAAPDDLAVVAGLLGAEK
ncbi:hypothetical protein FXF51_20065 [Nonomuraea sp. PA05]|uniref:hypothetical protein n=1 Tax=Nonomuraea sp. PA05 TaxID=2604466 RepID=UPI0011D3E40F|nr:hypothetical protein [Nonomuraea sp. PA05]TYB64758.1 hypothetical protein FXF51_20065 [Nonomuraea sp. PA05]